MKVNRKNLRITTILLDGTRAKRNLRTPPGRLLTPVGVDAVLKQEAERVEQFFPGREFRLVPLRDGNFNFVEVKPEFTTESSFDSAQDRLRHGEQSDSVTELAP